MAFVGKSPLATGTTSITPVYASATSGNLLVAILSGERGTAAQFTATANGTGWTQAVQENSTGGSPTGSAQTEIWYKLAVGSDTMPTWAYVGGSGAYMRCQVAEFSLTTVLDKTGVVAGSTTPVTVTAGGTDTTTSDLVVVGLTIYRASANAGTAFTHNVNGAGAGVGINTLAAETASQGTHHNSIYAMPTTGTSADSDAISWTTLVGGATSAVLASFSVAGTPTITGTASVTLPNLSEAATSVRTTFGVTAPTAGALTLAATSKRTTFGVAAVACGNLSIQVTSTPTLSGTASIALPAASVHATSVRTTFASASAISLPAPTVTVTGIRTVLGVATIVLDPPGTGGGGYGNVPYGDPSLGAATFVQAEGLRTGFASATTIAAGALTLTAVGVRTHFASTTIAVPALVIAAIGTKFSPDQGVVAMPLGTLTVHATSVRKTFGLVAVVLPTVTVHPTSVRTVFGVALIHIGGTNGAAVGVRVTNGTTTITMPPLTIAAIGEGGSGPTTFTDFRGGSVTQTRIGAMVGV